MIYTTQSVILRVETGIDLSGGSSPLIKYQKPSGETGEWTATVDGSELVYETSNTDFDEHGVWRFQSYITLSGNNKLGKVVKQTIFKRL